MNRKQFIILLVLVAIVGAAGLLIRQKNNDSWHGTAAIGEKLLPNLPVNDVAQLVIKSGADSVTLARENNLWRVHERNSYPANFSQISELILKLADLKASQNQDVGPSQLGRFELLPPGVGQGTATSVELKDQGGKSLGLLLLGKKHMKKPAGGGPQMGGMGDDGWPDGRYVMVGTGATSAALVSDPLDTVQAKPDQWLNKDFLAVEKPRTVSVQFPEATNSWKLMRSSETNDWQLADAKAGEKLDSSKISSVTSPLSSASFNDVAPLASVNTASNTVLTVETFDGFTYTSKIGPKGGENYPVTFALTANLPAVDGKADKDAQARAKTLADKLAKESACTNWVYQIPTYSLDEVLKTRDQLLEPPPTNSVAESTNSASSSVK